MQKDRTGRGFLRAEVAEVPGDRGHAQLVLRDDVGLVVMLPVRAGSLADVRRRLAEATPAEPCVLEIRGAEEDVHERWGTFARPADAAAVAVTLLAVDRHADHATVLDPVGHELLEVAHAVRGDG